MFTPQHSPLKTPLFQEAAKKKLSAEEAKALAADLVRKAKEKREAEERELEKLREKEDRKSVV